jgi:two-component system chemotaxis sensor kinase CheA
MTFDGFDALLGEYALDARERLDRVEQSLLVAESLAGSSRVSELARLKAELHTLKGNAAMMGFADLQQLAHAMEDRVAAGEQHGLDIASLLASLDDFRRRLSVVTQADRTETEDRRPGTDSDSAAAAGATADSAAPAPSVISQGGVRVPFAVLDPLMDLLAEMVIQRNGLEDLVSVARATVQREDSEPAAARAAVVNVDLAFDALGRTLDVVQERVMGLRMTPLQALFGPLQRLVHDESAREGKRVVLATSGGDTPLDKALLELANDALGHLVRNAVIHGLETPAQRLLAGKDATGTVQVTAAVRGGEVLVEVADDGAGIDPEQLRQAAQARGMVLGPAADPFDVLFASGFSTKSSADLSSGRGVGLSAVREAVHRQGGRIEVRSERSRGTAFRLWLPLSVTIARSLLLRADGELYALPLSLVVESRRLKADDGHELNGGGVMRWREETIAMLDLGVRFGTRHTWRREGYVIVVEAAGKRRGLVADAIIGLQEVVVRGLDPICGRAPGIAGSTVLGDGRPILILDARTLVDLKTGRDG